VTVFVKTSSVWSTLRYSIEVLTEVSIKLRRHLGRCQDVKDTQGREYSETEPVTPVARQATKKEGPRGR